MENESCHILGTQLFERDASASKLMAQEAPHHSQILSHAAWHESPLLKEESPITEFNQLGRSWTWSYTGRDEARLPQVPEQERQGALVAAPSRTTLPPRLQKTGNLLLIQSLDAKSLSSHPAVQVANQPEFLPKCPLRIALLADQIHEAFHVWPQRSSVGTDLEQSPRSWRFNFEHFAVFV